jgi:TP901 family phage tail tape measure protein
MADNTAISASAVLEIHQFIAGLNAIAAATEKTVSQVDASFKKLDQSIKTTTSAPGRGFADLTLDLANAGVMVRRLDESLKSLNTRLTTTANRLRLVQTQMEAAFNPAQFQGAVGAVNQVSGAYANMGAQMQAVQRLAQQTVQGQQAAAVAATQTSGAVTQAHTSTNLLGNVANAVGSRVTSAFTNMRSSAKSVADVLDTAVRPAFSKLSESEKQLLSVTTAMNGLFRAGTQLSSVGQTMFIMGAGILGLEGAAVKAAEGFDFWTRRIAAAAEVGAQFQTSGKAVSVDLGLLRDVVNQVAISVGAIKPEQVAQGMYLWASATGDAIDTQEKLIETGAKVETVLQAATIAGIDYQTAISGISQVQAEFGVSTNRTAETTAVLLNITQKTQAEFGDMVQAFKMVGPLAHSLGISVQEVAAVFGELSNAGIKGTQAGRGLAQVFTSLLRPSDQAVGALRAIFKLTGDQKDAWTSILYPGGQFVGLIDKTNKGVMEQEGLLTRVAKATRDMESAERNRYLAMVFSQNALREMVPLIDKRLEDLDTEAKLLADVAAAEQLRIDGTSMSEQVYISAKKALDDFYRSGGGGLLEFLNDGITQLQLFDAQWEKVSDSIRVKWGSAMNRITVSFQDIGTVAQGALIPVLNRIADVLDLVRVWMRDNKELTQSIVNVATAIGAVLAVIGALGFISGQLMQFVVLVRQVALAFSGFVGLIWDGLVAFNGLGAAILAIVAASAYMAQNGGQAWVDFTETMHHALGDILPVISTVIGDLVNFVNDLAHGDWAKAWHDFVDAGLTMVAYFVTYVPQLLQEFGTALLKVLDDHFNGIPSRMVVWGENMVLALGEGIMNGVGTLFSIVESVANTVASFFKSFSPPKTGPLKDIKTWGTNLVKSLAEGVKEGDKHADEASEHIAKTFSKKLEGHSPAKEGPLKNIKNWGKNLSKAFAQGFSDDGPDHVDSAADDVAKAFKPKLEGHSPAKEGPLSDISTWAKNLADVYGGEFSDSAIDAVYSGAAEVATAMREAYYTRMQGVLQETATLAGPAAGKVGQTLMEGVFAGFSKADFSAFNSIASTVTEEIQAAFQERLSSAKPKDKGSIAEMIFGNIMEARSAIQDAVGQIGGNVQGLLANFQDFSNVKESIAGFQQAVKDAFNPEPLERLRAELPEAAEDMRKLIAALSDVNAAQTFENQIDGIIAKVKEQRDNIALMVQGIKEHIAQIRAEMAPIDDAISGSKKKVTDLQEKKDPINEDIQKHRDKIDGFVDDGGTYHKGLQDDKQVLQDQVDVIRDKIDNMRVEGEAAQENVEKAQKQKDAIQDQITAVKNKYEIERKADQEKANGIQLQIDKQKLLDDQIELAMQKQISAAQAAGAPAAQVENMKKQLELTKQRHADDEKTLAIQKQIEEIANKDRDQARSKKETGELDTLKGQQDGADKKIEAAKLEKDNIDRAIKLTERSINSLQDQQKAIDKQIKLEEKAIKLDEARNRAIDRQILLEERKQKGLEQDKAAIEARAKAVEKGQLADAELLLKRQNVVLDEWNKRKAAADDEVKAAQERLELEKSAIEERKKVASLMRQVESAQGASDKATKDEKTEPSFESGAPKPKKGPEGLDEGLLKRVEELKKQIKDAMKPFTELSDEVKAKKAEIEERWKELNDGINEKLKKFSSLFEGFKGVNWDNVFPGLSNALRRLAILIPDDLQTIWNAISHADPESAIAGFRILWEHIGDNLGPVIQPILTKIGDNIRLKVHEMFGGDSLAKMDTIGRFIGQIGDMFGKLGNSIAQMQAHGNLGATIGGFAAAFGLLALAMSPVGAALASFAGWLAVIVPALAGPLGPMAAWILVSQGLQIALAALMTPVVAIGVAVAALGAAIGIIAAKNPEVVGGALARLGAALAFISKEAVDAFVQGLANLTPYWNNMVDSISVHGPALAQILDTLSVVFMALGGLLSGVITGVVTGLGAAFIGLVQTMGGLVGIIGGTLEVIGGFVGAIVQTIMAFVTAIQTGDIAGLWENIKNIWSGALQKMFEGVKQILEGLANVVFGIITGMIGLVGGLIGGFVQGIINFFKHLYDVLVGHSIIPDLVNAVVDWFLKMKDRALEFIGKLVEDAKTKFGEFATAIGDWITDRTTDWNTFWGTTVPDAIKNVWDTVKTNAETIWTNITTTLDAFITAAGKSWSDFWGGLYSKIDEAWKTISTSWTAVTAGLQKAWNQWTTGSDDGSGEGGFKGAWSTLWTKLHEVIDGVVIPLTTAWTAVTTAISTAWNNWATGSADGTGEGGFKGAWLAMWSALQGAINGLKVWVDENWSKVTDTLKAPLEGLNNALQEVVGKFNAIKTAAEAAWSAMTKALPSFLGGGGGGGGGNSSGPGAGGGRGEGGASPTELFEAVGMPFAQSQLNKPYLWGGNSPGGGFDCSGFVQWVYSTMGINIPKGTMNLHPATKRISQNELMPGDFVFYNMDNPDPHIQHVALYMGGGRIIESGGIANNVNVTSMYAPGTPEPRRLGYAKGGWLPEPIRGVGASGTVYDLAENESELILNQSQVKTLLTMLSAKVGGGLITGVRGLQALSGSATAGVSAATSQAPVIYNEQFVTHLHVGTLVADDSGLRQLEQKLYNFRVVENARRGQGTRR